MSVQTNDQELNKEKIENIFLSLDHSFLEQGLTGPKEFFIIGSSIIITLGMPNRLTMDIDFYGNAETDKVYLENASRASNILFDPDDYMFLEEPYIQWVRDGFVHMPLTKEWKDDASFIWEGSVLRVRSPPVGVILGSKLAAGRAKDLVDAEYLINTFQDWKSSLDKYSSSFSPEDQEQIKDNLMLVELSISSSAQPSAPSLKSSKKR